MHVDRTGGSLSLSENEFDSDELDTPLNLVQPKPKTIKESPLETAKKSPLPFIFKKPA